MRYACLLALVILQSCATSPQRHPSSAPSSEELSPADLSTYRKLLRDSLLFYRNAFRDPKSGQYYDARPLNPKDGADYNSSVAATGMGLVALALSDAGGVQGNAREEALHSLRFAMGEGKLGGRAYTSLRSRTGWFRHWFDARTGANNDASIGDGFSTIDTAILVAGAQLAASYFEAAGKDKDGELRRRADALLQQVQWESAISDLDKGSLYLNYDLATQAPKASTAVFNEYVLVACLGASAEKARGAPGAMTKFWNQHYASPANLPRKSYDGIELLTDHPGHFLSSFTMQFASYLCSSVSGSEEYTNFFRKSQQADRLWFSKVTSKHHLWGLGAGEVRHRDESGKVVGSYHADAIDDNPHLMVSPHIVAGFLPVYPDGVHDLIAMARNKECLYGYGEQRILWRCSLKDLSLPVDRVQAIDFSSMFLGLAAFQRGIGFEFYKAHGALAQ